MMAAMDPGLLTSQTACVQRAVDRPRGRPTRTLASSIQPRSGRHTSGEVCSGASLTSGWLAKRRDTRSQSPSPISNTVCDSSSLSRVENASIVVCSLALGKLICRWHRRGADQEVKVRTYSSRLDNSDQHYSNTPSSLKSEHYHSRTDPSTPRHTGFRQAWQSVAALRTASSLICTPMPGSVGSAQYPADTANTSGLVMYVVKSAPTL